MAEDIFRRTLTAGDVARLGATFNSETIELAKQAMQGALAKTTGIYTGLGLVGYPLEAPSKKLYPVLSPLVNSLPRIPVQRLGVGAQTGTAIHYKRITAINTANLWPFVAEGTRNSKITYTADDQSATFKTLGMEDSVTQEAVWAGLSYEDLRAYSALATLQALKVSQEYGVLGGNASVLGNVAGTAADTTQQATGKGSLSNSTHYFFKITALTMQGVFQGAQGNNGSVDAAGETAQTGASTDIQTTAGGNAGDTTIDLHWTAKKGAFAYNVYCRKTTDSAWRWTATVYTNHYSLVADPPTTGGLVNTADQTAGANDYNGLIQQTEASGYYTSLDNATLTSDGAEGIAEIETVLQYQWDTNRVSPDVILVNSQEVKTIKKKMANAGSNSLARIVVQSGPSAQGDLTAGAKVTGYFNSFTDQVIPIKTHPYVPKGKMFLPCFHLPEWFPANEVPDAIVMAILEEYADYQFAFTSRAYEHGVYVSEVPIMYVPAFSSVITNIAAA